MNEIVIILIVCVVTFGMGRLPRLAAALGKRRLARHLGASIKAPARPHQEGAR